MLNLSAFLSFLLILSSSSFAATPVTAAAPATTAPSAGTQKPAASAGNIKLSFELSPMGSFDAKSTAVTGDVTNSGGKLIPPSKVKVDMRTLTTGIKLRDQHLQKSLDTTKFPVAVFTGITVTSASAAKGTLSFHGKSHPVEFTFSSTSAKDKVKANFKLKISDWGVTEGLSYMGVNVEDEVAAEIEMVVKK